MTVIGVASLRSSPGATSLAVGMSWAVEGPVTLVEADPAGGVLAARFGLDATRDLLSFGIGVRRTFVPELLFAHTTSLGLTHCLLSPADPPSARRAIDMTAETLGAHLCRFDMTTVVDLGCLSTQSPAIPLAKRLDRLLLVAKPALEDVPALLDVLSMVRTWIVPVDLVLIGSGPFKADEFAQVTGLPIAAVLPHDPRVASAYSGGVFSERSLRRSSLNRAITALTEDVVTTDGQQTTQPPPPAAPEEDARAGEPESIEGVLL